MQIAIMQPYFFPYIGYFQLLNAVDKFVFYDDVHFITRGYINRNALLVNGQKKLITLKLSGASQNKLINEITLASNNSKILKTIQMAYSKAPYFSEAFPIIESVFETMDEKALISEIAALSVKKVAEYLEMKVELEFSSQCYPETRGMGKAERLIAICKKNNIRNYINAAGGKELYTKDQFLEHNISLHFINNHWRKYRQFGDGFIPNLSIIDVMMFNSPEEIRGMLNDYELE